MERWSTIDADNIHLATLRIWNERDHRTNKQHMSIYIPSDQPGAPAEEYKLDMVQESVENQIVIAEMEKEPDNLVNRASAYLSFYYSMLY
jgi:transcription initiation factor TFIIF subunit beta